MHNYNERIRKSDNKKVDDVVQEFNNKDAKLQEEVQEAKQQ